ncbi:hypothetical protein [Microbacterium sp. PA5]|uniref:hypothetical protein n=1 Tax=Microbacterium sp. PA5 TaxID=3416654 RepID=UPI003CF56275
MDPLLGWGSIIFSSAAIVIAAWLGLRGKRGETSVAETEAQQAALNARFDDASQIAKYIDERVEQKVKPIRDELATVKAESSEMHHAVRARETQLWLWDLRGRAGDLPMLPAPILERLGLGHLLGLPLEDTEPTTPKAGSS